LDYLSRWQLFSKGKSKKIIIDNEEYIWVNYLSILKNLPMLNIKSKSRLSEIIRSLKKNKLIKLFQSKDNTLYYRLTDLAVSLYIEDTCSEKRTALFGKTNSPVRKNEQHNTTINNTTINNINSIIAEFEPINPSYEILFQNKTQRMATERLINLMGEERLINLVRGLPQLRKQKYAPVITTPYQLEQKLGQLMAFIEKQNNSKIGVV
jgi:hypothetical protein